MVSRSCKVHLLGRAGLAGPLLWGGQLESGRNIGLSLEFGPGSLRFLGFVPLGQRVPERILVLFPQLRFGPNMSEQGDRTWESGHTREGLSFSGLLWLILRLCKYVCRHF